MLELTPSRSFLCRESRRQRLGPEPAAFAGCGWESPSPGRCWPRFYRFRSLAKPAVDREMLLLEDVGSRNHQRELR